MPCKGRKHTPITTRKQQKFFGAELGKKEKGQKGKTGMTKTILRRHLSESGGKKLPRKKR